MLCKPMQLTHKNTICDACRNERGHVRVEPNSTVNKHSVLLLNTSTEREPELARVEEALAIVQLSEEGRAATVCGVMVACGWCSFCVGRAGP
jgi:hypothetical protein